jgi:4-hydroxybenzoate polyprenyltransferase
MFMINDVEDADDDALTPHKAVRNPIAAGALSLRSGWWASALVALAAGFLFLLLGVGPALCGWLSLLIGYIYSWRKVRLKNYPVVDVLSHGMMLAGLQFLVGFLAFEPGTHWWWFFPFLMVISISLYGQLYNELRDFHGDREAGLRHSAMIFGFRTTQVLMYSLLGIGVACTIIILFAIRIFPWWVLFLNGILLALLVVPPLLRLRHRGGNSIDRQGPFQKPFEISFALSLAAWYLLPWIERGIGVYILR